MYIDNSVLFGFKNNVHFQKDYPNLHIQSCVCLTPHLIHVFQLYRCNQFYWSRTSEYRCVCIIHVLNHRADACHLHISLHGRHLGSQR